MMSAAKTLIPSKHSEGATPRAFALDMLCYNLSQALFEVVESQRNAQNQRRFRHCALVTEWQSNGTQQRGPALRCSTCITLMVGAVKFRQEAKTLLIRSCSNRGSGQRRKARFGDLPLSEK